MKKAIVTGAGTGIGQGVAVCLGKAGYDVVVHYHSSAQGAEETCRLIREAGANAYAPLWKKIFYSMSDY